MSLSFPTHQFRAMGSHIQVWVEATPEDAQIAFNEVERIFHEYEQMFTRFRDDSELRTINRQGGGKVTAPFFTIVQQALEWAERTDGCYDPTMLQHLKHAGYRQNFVPNQTMDTVTTVLMQEGNYRDVVLDHATQSVQLHNGVQLDLNGIVKGWTAQVARDAIRHFGACLIDAGGDVVAGDAPRGFDGWMVSVTAPNDGTQEPLDLFGVWLRNATIATSGVDYRRWVQNGQSMHHLIDPMTGEPTKNDTQTVTVIAQDAICAEVWATAGCVLGSEAGIAIFEDQKIAGCFHDQDESTITTDLEDQIAVYYQ